MFLTTVSTHVRESAEVLAAVGAGDRLDRIGEWGQMNAWTCRLC